MNANRKQAFGDHGAQAKTDEREPWMKFREVSE